MAEEGVEDTLHHHQDYREQVAEEVLLITEVLQVELEELAEFMLSNKKLDPLQLKVSGH
jgi:hypothetical protein